MLKIENIIIIELKKLAQYWKKIIFKYDLGSNLSKVFLFLLKKLFFSNQVLETVNLYKINSEFNSNKNKNVYILFDKKINGIKILKLINEEK